VDAIKVRFPAELTADEFTPGDQNGWIAGAPRRHPDGNLMAADLQGGLNDFTHRETTPVAQIVGAIAMIEGPEGADSTHPPL
jgi:hypothetical protein